MSSLINSTPILVNEGISCFLLRPWQQTCPTKSEMRNASASIHINSPSLQSCLCCRNFWSSSVTDEILTYDVILVHTPGGQRLLHGGHHGRRPGYVVDRATQSRQVFVEHYIINGAGLPAPGLLRSIQSGHSGNQLKTRVLFF